MTINLKKALLAGTAIVAVSAFVLPSQAFADAETLTTDTVWASTGAPADGTLDGTTAAADDAVDIDGYVLTITNDQTANDGSGLDTFNVGAITDSAAGGADSDVVIVQAAAGGALDVTIASHVSADTDNDFTVDNDDGADADVTVAVTGVLTVGQDVIVTNNEADAANTVALTVGGVADVTGDFTVVGGGFAGANSTVTFADDASANAYSLDDGTASATLVFAGTAAQAVAGTIDGQALGEGTVSVTNTDGTVTFADDIGSTSFDLLAFTQAASTTVNTAGALEALTITLGASSVLDADGAVVGGIVAGSGSSVDFADDFTGDFTGGSGVQTITVSGTGNVGGAGAYTGGSGNDVINITGGATIDFATLDGGTGTDVIALDGADATISGDISGFNVTVDDDDELTLTGDMTGGKITLDGDAAGTGAELVINGGTVSATLTGSADDDTVTLTTGTLSGNSSLGLGADTLNYDGGSITGTVAFGGGADDVAIGGDVEIGAAMSGLETIVTGANTLTVSAAITGVDDADNTGVNVTGGVLDINSGGSIDGAIHGDAAALVDFGADTNGGTFNAGGIIEDAQLTVTSGTLNTNGFAFGANSALADIIVATDGIFNIDDDVTNTGSDVSVAGIATIGAGDTLSTDNLDVTGTLTIDVDSTTVFGSAVTTADVDISAGALTVNVGVGDLTDGDELLIVDGGAQVNAAAGQAAADVTDNSFLWSFQVADGSDAAVTGSADNQDLYLVVTEANSIASVSTSTNNVNAGTVLQSLSSSTDANVQSVLTSLNSAATAEAVNDVIESTQPTVDGGHVVGALSVSNQTMGVVGTQLASLRHGEGSTSTGMAAGNLSQGMRAWGQVFGQTAEQDQRDGIDGYDADTYGVAFGLDSENVSDNAVVGIAVAYADTEIDSDNANSTNTEIDSYQITLYGDYDIDEETYLSGMVGYVHGQNETTRSNVGGVSGLTANGEFDSSQYIVRAEVGRDYTYENMEVTPNLTANYVHYDGDDYTETGAGGAGQIVDQESLDVLELGLGVNVGWMLDNADGSYFKPEVRAAYRYDVIGDNVEATSQYVAGGSAYSVEGFDPAQSTFSVGTGVKYFSNANWEFTANYDFEIKEDYDAHSGFLRAGYKF